MLIDGAARNDGWHGRRGVCIEGGESGVLSWCDGTPAGERERSTAHSAGEREEALAKDTGEKPKKGKLSHLRVGKRGGFSMQ